MGLCSGGGSVGWWAVGGGHGAGGGGGSDSSVFSRIPGGGRVGVDSAVGPIGLVSMLVGSIPGCLVVSLVGGLVVAVGWGPWVVLQLVVVAVVGGGGGRVGVSKCCCEAG